MNEHNRTYRLRFNHKDFICKQLALFKSHRQVARELLKNLPEIPLSPDEAMTCAQYYAANNHS